MTTQNNKITLLVMCNLVHVICKMSIIKYIPVNQWIHDIQLNTTTGGYQLGSITIQLIKHIERYDKENTSNKPKHANSPPVAYQKKRKVKISYIQAITIILKK